MRFSQSVQLHASVRLEAGPEKTVSDLRLQTLDLAVDLWLSAGQAGAGIIYRLPLALRIIQPEGGTRLALLPATFLSLLPFVAAILWLLTSRAPKRHSKSDVLTSSRQ